MLTWQIYKSLKRKGNSQSGFVLIVALIAILIMMAIGFLALTTISGDMMITYRLIGENKALSAAESGVQAVVARQINPGTDNAIGNTSVDATNDPSASYSATKPLDAGGAGIVLAGNGASWTSKVYYVDVTGSDSIYNSTLTIRIGLADSGAPSGVSHSGP